MVDLHVLIPTTSRSSLLKRTLDCLVACRKPEGFAGLIVVENGVRHGAEELVSKYSQTLNARYVFEAVGSKNRAINRGLAEVKSGLVVLYDDDVRVDPMSLGAYADAADRWPDTPFFGGVCGCDYEQPPLPHVLPFLPLSAKGWDLGTDGTAIEQPHALGFNWAVRVEAVRELGGFVEDRGPGTAVIVGDEADMQRRMIEQMGPGRFVAGARVWHYIPADRCSEAWLVDRGYHYGMAKAMEERRRSAVTGVPLWVRRRQWTSAVKWLAIRWVGGRASRLKASYGLQINRGLVAGFRQSEDTQATRRQA